jgi:hypothetical protein
LCGGAVVEILASGPVGCVRQHIQIGQVFRFLVPEGLKRSGGVGPAFGEKIAESQQIARLRGVGLIAHHRLKRRNCLEKFTLPVVCQPNVEPDPRDLRHQVFRLLQSLESLAPLLAPHVDHTQVRIRSPGLRIDLQHGTEIALRFVQLAVSQGILPALKKFRRIRGPRVRRTRCRSGAAPISRGGRRGLARQIGRCHLHQQKQNEA